MNRKEYKEAHRQAKREFNKNYIYQFKLGKTCECCGNHYPPEVLDFHHKKPNQKDRSVAVASNNCWSTERLQKEIDKCILLCANCHRLVHSDLVHMGLLLIG